MPSAPLKHHWRELPVEQLLGRQPLLLDYEPARESVAGKVIAVTGAAGSIGSELCRQIAALGPRALVGIDQAETPLFLLNRELNAKFPGNVFHPQLVDVTHAQSVRRTMEQYRPSVVFHAAAYKHVSMAESNVSASVENNIFGTLCVARAAADHGVESFVLVSTDKAVRPASMMGATKRAAELAIRTLQRKGGTRFVTARFGNVLGSSGSVIPLLMEQIAAGGPVTVTHREVSRYFMTASEAAWLVLMAYVLGEGGETFALEMGQPMRILDMAENLIRLLGKEPGGDIPIRFTGLHDGEKLHEEMYLPEERPVPTSQPAILRLISQRAPGRKQFSMNLKDLRLALKADDTPRLLDLLKKMVPEYDPAAAARA